MRPATHVDAGADVCGTQGQFNYVNIVITPLDQSTNAVTVQCKQEISDVIDHLDSKIVCDAKLPLLVRQMAIHANVRSVTSRRACDVTVG